MKTLLAFLLMTTSALSQQVNNATVNIIGNNQNVVVNQSGANHSANLNLYGNDIPVSVTQSGNTPKSFSLTITCYSNCSSNPTVVNQY
jgi:hypothetical protein